MKVKLSNFKSNKDQKIKDIISNLFMGTTYQGLTTLKFETANKYHYVYNAGSNSHETYINIEPVLYNENGELMKLYHDVLNGNETNFDAYLKHPDYYSIELKVCMSNCQVIVIPLKYEYQITFIPNTMLFENIKLKKVQLED